MLRVLVHVDPDCEYGVTVLNNGVAEHLDDIGRVDEALFGFPFLDRETLDEIEWAQSLAFQANHDEISADQFFDDDFDRYVFSRLASQRVRWGRGPEPEIHIVVPAGPDAVWDDPSLN